MDKKCTNREYLATLDTPRLVEWILYEAVEIGKMSTHSPLFLAEWLDSEYEGWITVRERGEVIMRLIEEQNGKTV